jgi:hypothetical protein
VYGPILCEEITAWQRKAGELRILNPVCRLSLCLTASTQPHPTPASTHTPAADLQRCTGPVPGCVLQCVRSRALCWGQTRGGAKAGEAAGYAGGTCPEGEGTSIASVGENRWDDALVEWRPSSKAPVCTGRNYKTVNCRLFLAKSMPYWFAAAQRGRVAHSGAASGRGVKSVKSAMILSARFSRRKSRPPCENTIRPL